MAPSTTQINDLYKKFELSLPFARIRINHFMVRLQNAENECGSNGFVTVDLLSAELNSLAWADLKDKSSVFYKFITSDIFKNPSNSYQSNRNDIIDKHFLVMFALLHCAGTFEEKAKHFITLLEEHGVVKNGFIIASDQDFIPLFNQLCGLASFDLFAATSHLDTVDSIYSQEEIDEFRN